ncbi:MAG: radical SAM protein [Candidatus Moranbacteria bacterium]|nr:radical SAM protein [Candidatus Moranbacteria bacterium]
MKIALVVPNGQINMGTMGNVARPSLGVCYLKAYVSKYAQCTVKVFHQINESNENITRQILDFNPDLVGFSVMSCAFSAALCIAKSIKETDSRIKTVFGGEHVTGLFVDETAYGSCLMSNAFYDNPCIDFFIPFEGERPLLGLIQGLKEKKDFQDVPGIVFWDGIRVCVTSRVERVLNLDDLPMADRSDLPYAKYHSPDDLSDLEYMHTTRGCKFKCIYCATPVSNPGPVAKNSAERILFEMRFLKEQYNRKSFFFCDELFTTDRERIDTLSNGIINSDLRGRVDWRIFARADDVSGKRIDLDLMSKAGLKGLFFGIETMNPRSLKKLGKKSNPEQSKEAIRRTYDAGIDVWCSLMIGYPWETEIELRKSLDDYLEMFSMGFIKHTYVAFITPFPGTPFYNYCSRNNLIVNPKFLDANCNEPVLKTPVSKERMIEIYQEFISLVA